MTIRKLNKDDNFNKVAELIYATDQYIYPYWFYNFNNWRDVLVYLIQNSGSIFYYNNILIAEDDGNICGILIFLLNKDKFIIDYEELMKVNSNFKYTIEEYIIPTCTNIDDDTIHIPNISVSIESRRKGVATELIETLKKMFPNKNLEVDVLSTNKPAIELYNKEGFVTNAIKLG
ncbi:MAG: GNAT family N-acetyltransferase, partial [Clostridiales bacterium]|nr:GNAT family N-acetyltransferase [Clostridiales bacterium]